MGYERTPPDSDFASLRNTRRPSLQTHASPHTGTYMSRYTDRSEAGEQLISLQFRRVGSNFKQF
jgi:hypothetical protein